MIRLEEKHLRNLGDVFYDTNILFGLHGYDAGIMDDDNVAVQSWCIKIRDAATRVHVSQLTLSEFFHAYFLGQAQIYWKNNGIQVKKLKDFKKRYWPQYSAFFSMHIDIYDEIDDILAKYRIAVTYPNDPLAQPEDTNRLIYEYAKFLHLKYPKLDAADAFHLSIAKYAGVSNFLTMDKDFKGITDLTVFTPALN